MSVTYYITMYRNIAISKMNGINYYRLHSIFVTIIDNNKKKKNKVIIYICVDSPVLILGLEPFLCYYIVPLHDDTDIYFSIYISSNVCSIEK